MSVNISDMFMPSKKEGIIVAIIGAVATALVALIHYGLDHIFPHARGVQRQNVQNNQVLTIKHEITELRGDFESIVTAGERPRMRVKEWAPKYANQMLQVPDEQLTPLYRSGEVRICRVFVDDGFFDGKGRRSENPIRRPLDYQLQHS